MPEEHPNFSLLKKLDLDDIAGCADVLADDCVWHFFNPTLPDIQGDYVGRQSLQEFFDAMAQRINGTFKRNPFAVTPVGDELIIVQTKNTMNLEGRNIEVLAVVVWRVVDGRFVEAWDIPAVHSARASPA